MRLVHVASLRYHSGMPKLRHTNSSTMNIAFVVHRYGPDVGGGSEIHCREFAQRLAADHDVTVLTSCARDYITWANAFPAGPGSDGPVRVERFPVERRRDPASFDLFSQRVFTGRASEQEERHWFELNGPYMPKLIRALRERRDQYDVFVFFSFRYYHSFVGLPEVADRAVLVPTAEEDPAIRLKVLGEYFTMPKAIVFNTIEEREMLQEIAAGPLPPGEVTGSGIEPPTEPQPELLDELNIREPFFLYLGRVDPSKGCGEMLRWYRRFADEYPPDEAPPLLLAGKAVMTIPEHPAIRPLGYVSDALRGTLLAEARALIMPSPYESLSLVLLEAWNAGRPTLANGLCRVLKGQTRRAGGGLWYDHYGEFAEGLRWLMAHPEAATTMGAQGRRYVDEHYRWSTVTQRLKATLAHVVGPERL